MKILILLILIPLQLEAQISKMDSIILSRIDSNGIYHSIPLKEWEDLRYLRKPPYSERKDAEYPDNFKEFIYRKEKEYLNE